MSTTNIIGSILDALIESVGELASSALQMEGSEVVERSDVLPTGMSGALIALVNPEVSAHIGFFATEKECEAFSRALLMMEPDEEELTEEDVTDALGEIINIAAGGVKTKVSDAYPSLTLGLPVCMSGKIRPTDNMVSMSATVAIGSETARLVVLMSKNG